jgi:type I restriction enzyme, S subunit
MTLRVHPDEIVRSSTASLLAIHESWRRVRLGDVAAVLNGFAFKSQFFGDEGVPLLRIRDVGKSDTRTMYSGEYDEAYLVQPGELVVGMDGDFRVAPWAGRPALLNQRVCKITVRDTELYEPQFLRYALPGYLDAVNAHTSSVTVKHLSSRTVQDIPLPLPPLSEQRRIVAAIEEHLSRLDAAGASLADAGRRLDGFTSASLTSAVDGSWPERQMSDVIVSLRNGVFVSRPAAAPPGTAIFRISAVRPLALDVDDVRYAPLSESVASKYLVDEGDLLFTRYSGNRDYVGACARVPKLPRATLHPDKLIRVVVDREQVEPAFVEIACSTGRSRDEIRSRRKTTAGQVGIAGGQLRSVPIPVPPLDEQRRIVAEVEERLSAIDAMRAAIDLVQRRSAALRRAVLERAFHGELVPQDSSDEPAEALLARIHSERESVGPIADDVVW